MDVNTLAVETRTTFKKTANKNLRKKGNIPAVVYGHTDPRHIAISEREFEKKFHTVSENTIITLLENDKKIADVLLKDWQEDMRTQRIVHIDFFEVDTQKKLRTNVPVFTEGASVGVKAGGILEQLVHDVEVECFPKDIPEKITINVDTLDIGGSVHLKDLKPIDGVKFIGLEDTVLIQVVHVKAVVEDEAAASDAQGSAEAGSAAGE